MRRSLCVACAILCLVLFVECQTFSLFDLATDPFESVNVYEDSAFFEDARALEERMLFFQRNVSTVALVSQAVDRTGTGWCCAAFLLFGSPNFCVLHFFFFFSWLAGGVNLVNCG
jgi:hypothetical protein